MMPQRAQAKHFQKFIRARCLESRSSARVFPARYVCDEQVSAYVSIIGMGVAFSSRNAGYVGLGGIWIREEGDGLRWGVDSVGVIAEEGFLSLRMVIEMLTGFLFYGMNESFFGIVRKKINVYTLDTHVQQASFAKIPHAGSFILPVRSPQPSSGLSD